LHEKLIFWPTPEPSTRQNKVNRVLAPIDEKDQYRARASSVKWIMVVTNIIILEVQLLSGFCGLIFLGGCGSISYFIFTLFKGTKYTIQKKTDAIPS